ncbi:MAG: PAS domain S-box protein [Candidatus Daviesbacteria bacterium]|nr:PAS domain S-box protein [Candidatus Daviesbacteria bacterium]
MKSLNTKLTKSEEALRRSEERFRRLIEVSSEAIWVTDASGGIIEDSLSWRIFTGRKYKDFLGWNWLSAVHADDRNLLKKVWRHRLKTKTPSRVEFRQLNAKGEYRIIKSTAVPIFDGNGKVLEWIGMNQDITELKQAEEALRENERLLKRSQEIAQLGSWELDLLNNKLTWSDEAYRIFGLKPQEFKATYEAFLKTVHPDDREKVNLAYTESLRKKLDGYEIIHRIIRKNTSEIRIVHEKCEHIKNKSGTVIKSIGMTHDITELKKAEEQLTNYAQKLELLNNSLEEMLAKQEALFESIGDGIIVVDKYGVIIKANRKTEDLFGWNVQKILGKSIFKQVELEDEQDNLIPSELHPTLLALNTAQVVRGVYFLVKKDKFPLLITSSPVILDNAIVGAISVYRDYSQQLAINQAKDEFVSLASHELRTPLSAVAWSLERLFEDQNLYSNSQKKSLDKIYKQTQNMIELTSNLLTTTKIELGVHSYTHEKIDPIEIASNVIENLKDRIKDKKIKFNFFFDKDIKPYKTYSNAIYIILRNLLSNAVKFTSSGGWIRLKIQKLDDKLILQVTDSGIGIPRSAQEKIFQKIYRANNVKNRVEGTGLGLYITKAMVNYLKGNIIVESKVNKGSTFMVMLPFAV